MSDEHTVSLQSSMQFRPTRWPVVVLQTFEEQFPEWREIMLCADKRILRICMSEKQNVLQESYATFHFLWSQIVRMISYICRGECTL